MSIPSRLPFRGRMLATALVSGIALSASLMSCRPVGADDHIFPPQPQAKAAIDFDRHGFLIHGKRTFLVSAGIEYARVPRALWRDRLLRLKRAGFNCVEFYTFWNFHEPEEGKFDFSGDHDLDAFLKLVHELGMYAIARVGPYYCAEWDSGGYPIWLRFHPEMRVREDDSAFEAAVDRFFGQLLRIVAANQVNHGGAVVLVQLENEHPAGWGTEMPNGYFRHLRETALRLGIEVPTFFSGLHHGSDPAGNRMLDDANRPNPWMSTEFWCVWFDRYGASPEDAAVYRRRTWKIIAHGGNGYNYYMAHGGSDFDYTNNNEDAASYDYGAAVGQAGDLRPVYYTMKSAAWFARSFQDVLENSDDATGDYRGAVVAPGITVTARRSPAGTIVFLDNRGSSPIQTQLKLADGPTLPAAGPLTLAPGEIIPIIHGVRIAPDVTIAWSAARILGVADQGNTTTLVIYGSSGSPAELDLAVAGSARVEAGADKLQRTSSGGLALRAAFPAADAPDEYRFTVGTRRFRVLAVNDRLADRTWIADAGGKSFVVCGPSYLGDTDMVGGHLQITTEQPWSADSGAAALTSVVAFGEGVAPLRLQPAAGTGSSAHPTDCTLHAWETRSGANAVAPAFDDRAWKSSADPLPMGADGDLTADAWYRSTLTAPSDGEYTLRFASIRDRVQLFVDGAAVPTPERSAALPLSLKAGQHTVALFTAHDGRDKLFGHQGPLTTIDAKGLTGPALLQQTDGVPLAVSGWRVLRITGNPGENPALPAADAPGWTAYTIGDDAFDRRPGYAWFQATLPASPSAASAKVLRFESVDDDAVVYLNGRRIGGNEGWDHPFEVAAGDAWRTDGPNVLTLLVRNTNNVGGIDKPVTLAAYRYSQPVTGWRLRGGPGDPNATAGWTSLGATETAGPRFYRTEFSAAPPALTGVHPIWRVVTTGLGHGSVWVNGHNLGRYPERIPIDGLYIPECWLKPGANTLTIYDEDGKRPDQVSVRAEVAASRDVSVLTAR